ncbi:putative 1-acyl-sn-glycerol-3-phosphate acyltransferase acl-2-like [Tropilaelaps mercedesae]|uniref:1-acyl-sn-glycerol-3-phosphate acyltransferase n=1 Tax=Tropilaelaps mercedesae TaxID=418985 RepID=A0A1V9X6R2_9ACAR|nr:putative 1-acyl-sn-glycerol-3-phosphate acyltransferase acl-2-like [Tropilaelaps mercedesae]
MADPPSQAFVRLVRVLWHLLVSIVVLATAFSISPRARYWSRMMLYFIVVQLIGLLMLPVALLDPGNPQNFRRGARLMSYVRGLFGVRWKLYGQENIKDKAYIIVSNHQSSVDALGMLANWEAFDPVVPVMKGELRYALTLGLFCSLSGAVFVDRGSEKGRRALQQGLEQAKRTKKSMWIFPEGTRNRTNFSLLPFKKGAFHMAVQAHLPILPVVFSDYSSFYSKSEQRFEPGSASMTVLPEISTDDLTSDDVTDLCELTRNIMLNFMNNGKQNINSNSKGDYCTKNDMRIALQCHITDKTPLHPTTAY